MAQLRWIKEIILDGIAGTIELNIAERRYHSQRLYLNLPRQRTREPVYIEFMRKLPFRFEEKLMTLLVGKRHYLCLDRWAISGTDTFYLSIIERRVCKIIMENLVHLRTGVHNVAISRRQGSLYGRKIGELMEISFYGAVEETLIIA